MKTSLMISILLAFFFFFIGTVLILSASLIRNQMMLVIGLIFTCLGTMGYLVIIVMLTIKYKKRGVKKWKSYS